MANAQPNSEAPFADVPSAVEEFRADLEGPGTRGGNKG